MLGEKIVNGGEFFPPFLYINIQMPFNCFLNFPLLNTNIPLRNSCTTMLQKMLYKGNIIAVILINLRGIVFTEAVGTDTGKA